MAGLFPGWVLRPVRARAAGWFRRLFRQWWSSAPMPENMAKVAMIVSQCHKRVGDWSMVSVIGRGVLVVYLITFWSKRLFALWLRAGNNAGRGCVITGHPGRRLRDSGSVIDVSQLPSPSPSCFYRLNHSDSTLAIRQKITGAVSKFRILTQRLREWVVVKLCFFRWRRLRLFQADLREWAGARRRLWRLRVVSS